VLIEHVAATALPQESEEEAAVHGRIPPQHEEIVTVGQVLVVRRDVGGRT
jgi:hypothetical protein